jgi:hypothetical protein
MFGVILQAIQGSYGGFGGVLKEATSSGCGHTYTDDCGNGVEVSLSREHRIYGQM